MARADYGCAPAAPRTIRCAIYTRKSTEDGLEQEFNSLDAQREACAAYVLSQRHEGWVLVPGLYDDGGYSGGSLERPGLRAVLGEVRANRIDVIVVYKVDRLTRSLADFAKIVEILDAADASFVSVTQAFNTTTSMGRLTLNVLLSFAQFEREVTGERIRDKIAASKKKGMWMGGVVPLGYEVKDRKLVVNEVESRQVPVIPSAAYVRMFGLKSAADIVREAVLELTYTANDLAPFARDMGHVDARGQVLPPFAWDEDRRLYLCAKLDALYFILYGVFDPADAMQSRSDIHYIYSTFPIVEREETARWGRYRSRDLCLVWLNALTAGQPDATVCL